MVYFICMALGVVGYIILQQWYLAKHAPRLVRVHIPPMGVDVVFLSKVKTNELSYTLERIVEDCTIFETRKKARDYLLERMENIPGIYAINFTSITIGVQNEQEG